MTDGRDIRFDTSKVRGFAEYLFHLWDTKYRDRATAITARLSGGGDGASMGSSGVEYDGLLIGRTEVANARAGGIALAQFMAAWESLAKAGAYAAESFADQDGDGSADLAGRFTDTDAVITEHREAGLR